MADYGLRGIYFPDDYWTDGDYSYWPVVHAIAYIIKAADAVDRLAASAVDRIANASVTARVTGAACLNRLTQTFVKRLGQ